MLFRFGSGLFISEAKSEDWIDGWWKFPVWYTSGISEVISLCPLIIGTSIVSALDGLPVSIPVCSRSFPTKAPLMTCTSMLRRENSITAKTFYTYLALQWLPKLFFPVVRSTQTCAESSSLVTVNAATDLRAEVSHFFSVKATKLLFWICQQDFRPPRTECAACVFTANLLRRNILYAVFEQTRKSSESCNVVVRGVLWLVNSAHLYLSAHRFKAVGHPLIIAAHMRNATASGVN